MAKPIRSLADDAAWLQAIADEAGLPLESVTAMYREEYDRLHARARVFDFLPVLATSNLKRKILREHHRRSGGHTIVTAS